MTGNPRNAVADFLPDGGISGLAANGVAADVLEAVALEV